MCVCIPPPGAARGAAEEGAGPRRGEDGGAGGAASKGRGRACLCDGGRARKNQLLPISSPRCSAHPPRSRLARPLARFLRGSGVGSRLFLASRQNKNGARVHRGEGREAAGTAREPAYICLLPAAPGSGERPGPRAAEEAGAARGPPAPWASSPAWAATPVRPAVASRGREALPRTRPRPGRARCSLGWALRRPPARPVPAGGPGRGGLWRGLLFVFHRFYFLILIFIIFFGPEGFAGPWFPSRPESGFSGWGRRAGGR